MSAEITIPIRNRRRSTNWTMLRYACEAMRSWTPSTSGVAKSEKVQIKTRSAPATYPGVVRGSVIVTSFFQPRAPTLSAASSSAGSILARASTTFSVIIGKRWSVSTSRTPCSPYTKFNGLASPNQSSSSTFTVPARPMMNVNPRTPTRGGEMIGIKVR